MATVPSVLSLVFPPQFWKRQCKLSNVGTASPWFCRISLSVVSARTALVACQTCRASYKSAVESSRPSPSSPEPRPITYTAAANIFACSDNRDHNLPAPDYRTSAPTSSNNHASVRRLGLWRSRAASQVQGLGQSEEQRQQWSMLIRQQLLPHARDSRRRNCDCDRGASFEIQHCGLLHAQLVALAVAEGSLGIAEFFWSVTAYTAVQEAVQAVFGRLQR